MLVQLASIFVDVVAPVFAIVALGWALGPRLGLEAKTLSRASYAVFMPAFAFDVISRSEVPLGSAGRMAAYAVVAHLVFGALAWGVARALGRSREIAAAYVMVAVFGNTGNFGIALITFRFGPAALAPATIFFVVIVLTSFVVCVGIAAWIKGGRLAAVVSVFRTPAIVVSVPALLASALHVQLPTFVVRTAGLLGGAMVPVMLLGLGVQLAETRGVRAGTDALVASAIRLVAAPVVALLLAGPFGLSGVERAAGILQSSMPSAVLAAIIANEYAIEPHFVTTAVLVSTVLSLPTLTVLLAVL